MTKATDHLSLQTALIKQFLEKLLQRWFPAPFPRSAADQTAKAGLHHPYSPLDLRAEFQGGVAAAVRL